MPTGAYGLPIGRTPYLFPRRWDFFHDEATVTVGTKLQVDHDTTINYGYESYLLTSGSPALGNAFTQSFCLQAGLYTFTALASTTANNRGIVDWYVDNVNQGSMDFYSASVLRNVLLTMTFNIPFTGYHTLKGVTSGHNASGSSPFYYITVIKYWLAPSAD